jgi:3-isopropylmalate/(R)-2-methylmalate dehydratase small subunit
VDLERQVLTAADGTSIAFQYDAYRKQALLVGLDDIGMTLRLEDRIERFQAEDRKRRPWIHSFEE